MRSWFRNAVGLRWKSALRAINKGAAMASIDDRRLPVWRGCAKLGPAQLSEGHGMPIDRSPGLRHLALTAALLGLGGCGAEVAGSAADVGALQASAAERARAQQAQIVDQIKQTQDAAAARAASAGE